jgi:hypothetical protein
VTDDGDPRAAVSFVVNCERPADRRHHLEHRKKVGGDPPRAQHLGLPGAFAPENDGRFPGARQSGEHVLTIAPVEEILRGRAVPRARRVFCDDPLANRDKAIARLEWQRPKDNGIDEREDRCENADAEGEHQQRDHGEAGGHHERTIGVAEVVDDAAHVGKVYQPPCRRIIRSSCKNARSRAR